MAVPDYAKLSKFEDINYLCNIRDEKDFNVKFVRDKGVIILWNCYTDGKLINISKTETSVDPKAFKPWVKLSIRKFQISGREVSILQWVLASWFYKLNSEKCLKFLEPFSCLWNRDQNSKYSFKIEKFITIPITSISVLQ